MTSDDTHDDDTDPWGEGEGIGRYADLAAGFTRTALDVTGRALAQFVRQGEVAADRAEQLVDDAITRAVDGSGALAGLVRAEVERAAERAGFARADDLEAVRRQIAQLRDEVLALLRGDEASHDGSSGADAGASGDPDEPGASG